MKDDEEITQQTISISEIDDAEFFLLEIEMNEALFQFVLGRETAIWLANEIIERSGENM